MNTTPRTYESTVGVVRSGGIPIPTLEDWMNATDFTGRAATDAKANLPPADATAPTATVTDLHTIGQKRAQLNVTLAEQAVHEAAVTLAETRIEGLDPGMAEAQIHDNLLTHGEKHRAAIESATQEAGKRTRDLAAFKHARGIEREATYSTNRANTLALLVMVILVEAIANAAFFKGAGDGGLLGSLLLTVVVAAVNVGALGFLVGRYPAPWAFSHPSPRMRGLGWALLVMAGVTVFGLNLFVSHFRDAAVSSPNVDFRAIVPVLVQPWRWLAYHQLASLVLFFVGLVCAALGFLKGYHFDDPIWGYGPVTRIAKEAEEVSTALLENVSLEMQGIMTRKSEALKAHIDAQTATVQEHRRLLADVERAVADRRRAIVINDQAIARAQQTYVEINRRIRPQAMLPAWATTPPTFAALAEELPALDTLKAMIVEEEGVLAANRKVVIDFIRGLPKLREKVITGFLARIQEADFKALPPEHLGPQNWTQMFKDAAE
jgi:hypothetical protein